jgi:hypothetical protein
MFRALRPISRRGMPRLPCRLRLLGEATSVRFLVDARFSHPVSLQPFDHSNVIAPGGEISVYA